MKTGEDGKRDLATNVIESARMRNLKGQAEVLNGNGRVCIHARAR